MNNLIKPKVVHVICWDHREYDRKATLLEIEQLRKDPYCQVKIGDDGIILDFRGL